jgi:hypothetical protein
VFGPVMWFSAPMPELLRLPLFFFFNSYFDFFFPFFWDQNWAIINIFFKKINNIMENKLPLFCPTSYFDFVLPFFGIKIGQW